MHHVKLTICIFLLLGVLAAPMLFVLGCSLGEATTDPFLDEISATHGRYAVAWDEMRGGAKDAEDCKRLREKWRAERDEAIRQVYLRHGRAVPAELAK